MTNPQARIQRPIKVLFVITGLGRGGAERVVVDLADRLFERGHEPVIVRLTGPAIVVPRNSEIPFLSLDIGGAFTVARGMLRLRALIRTLKPDVVHSHLVHANILARLLRLFVRMNYLITTAHNTNEESVFRMWAYRATNGLADLSTNVSAEAVQAFERDGAMAKGQMQVVHNGIDVARFVRVSEEGACLRASLGVGERETLLLAVGRLEAPKDFHNLLDALQYVQRFREDWQCLIAGEGDLKAELCRKVDSVGLTGRVRFLGARDDIPVLLSAADCFVLSSAWEGFPLVVGEAMACGLPVVATDCGGVSEFLGPNRRFLVGPRDPEALGQALMDMLALPHEERRRIGEDLRQRVVSEFSLDVAVDRWLRIYQSGSDLAAGY